MRLNSQTVTGVDTVTIEREGHQMKIWLTSEDGSLSLINLVGESDCAPILEDKYTPDFLKEHAN